MSIKPLINNQFHHFLFGKLKPSSIKSQRVLVDFSSPNIAKPFHPGHLRATLLGNFVCNINRVFGHEVHGLNYLGDWGTQFGYLLHGINTFNDENGVQELSLKHLYEVYVRSYKEFSNEIGLHAIRAITSKLENGDAELLESWMNVKNFSFEKLKIMYKRLGVEFDSFEFESDYVKLSKDLVTKWQLDGKFVSYHDGALCYDLDGDNKATLLTKDGSSLYITRDIAAAVSRFKTYRPHRIHYVVENGQTLHFERLRQILNNLDYDVGDKSQDLVPQEFHIKFGRVLNMSTRAGNVIFLDDILDHGRSLMMDRLRNKGRVTLTDDNDLERTCEDLGRTLLFCEFLRAPRNNSFNFVWDRDNLGFKLQYCRVSLNSLEKRCSENGIEPDLADCFELRNYEYFGTFRSASQLVEHILKFDGVLLRCYLESESCYLVQHISKMIGLVNNSLKELNVINCHDKAEAQCRLRLFSVAKFVLDLSFKILGLPILNRI